jgi:hypothetical protein
MSEVLVGKGLLELENNSEYTSIFTIEMLENFMAECRKYECTQSDIDYLYNINQYNPWFLRDLDKELKRLFKEYEKQV